MSKRTENKYLAVAVKVDGEEVMALIRPFGGDRDMTTIHTADDARATALIAAVAKRRKELNGEWKPDWSYGDKKYFIEYCKEYKLYANHFLSICSGSPFGYFKSSCRAVAIIDEYEDDLIWYFTEYLPSIN